MNEMVKIINEQEVLGKDFKMYGTVENPLFLAKDVAEWIENKQPTQMVESVDDDEKLKCLLNTSGQNRNVWFLTEDGLYEVLMQSRKPIAKHFKKEVKTILKTIRKTGGYVADTKIFVDTYLPFADDNTKNLFRLQLDTISQLNKKIEADKSLVSFANRVSNTDDLIDMNEFAKLINDKYFPIGRNKLFSWLRENKYLRKNNEPYQKFINSGLFKVREYTYNTKNGEEIGIKTYITGKGQVYLTEKLCDEMVADQRYTIK